MAEHSSLHGLSAAHTCVCPSVSPALEQPSTAVCVHLPLHNRAGLSPLLPGGCSTSHQLCAVLGASQVTAKPGSKREERKVRAVRLLVCSYGSGVGSPQVPPPTASPSCRCPSQAATMANAGTWVTPAERDLHFSQIRRNAEGELTGYCSWDNSLPFCARNVNTNRVSYELRGGAGICQLAASDFVRDVITDMPHCLPSASFCQPHHK